MTVRGESVAGPRDQPSEPAASGRRPTPARVSVPTAVSVPVFVFVPVFVVRVGELRTRTLLVGHSHLVCE